MVNVTGDLDLPAVIHYFHISVGSDVAQAMTILIICMILSLLMLLVRTHQSEQADQTDQTQQKEQSIAALF